MRAWKFLKVLVMVLIAGVVFGYVVERLWNWLMPGIFGLPPITYWQALGLFVLSKILFGGVHKHGGRGRRNWKRDMKRKFAHMSPEERVRFQAAMKERWACRPHGHEADDVMAEKGTV